MPQRINRTRLEELIDEATVDCYGEEEENTAFLTMIEEHVGCPFRAKVVGEMVDVTRFEWPKSGNGILAQWRVCFEWPQKSPGPINVEIVDYH